MNITEKLKELIEGVEISEDALMKLKLMIESAITERVEEKTNELQEQIDQLKADHESEIAELKESANAYAETVVAEMSEKLDSYTSYVVETFVADNKSQLVESAEYARMKTALSNVQEAFASSGFVIAESENNDSLSKVEELKGKYNELFESHTKTRKELEALKREKIFEDATSELSETKRERVKNLVESMKFDNDEDFNRAVSIMVEEVSTKQEVITEDDKGEPEKEPQKDMALYAQYL